MHDVQLIFNTAYAIMNIKIVLFGYVFTLFQVCLYSMIGTLFLFIVFRASR